MTIQIAREETRCRHMHMTTVEDHYMFTYLRMELCMRAGEGGEHVCPPPKKKKKKKKN